MNGGLVLEIRAEMLRARRQWTPLLLILLAGAAAASTPLVLLLGQELARIQGQGSVSLTGFRALVAGVKVGIAVGALSLAVVSGTILAGEASLGTMRSALAWEVRRRDWYLAKAVILLGWSTVLAIAVWGSATLSAGALGFGDITDPDFPEYVYIGSGPMWGFAGRVALLSLLALWTAAAVGMFVSAVIDSPAYAVLVTAALFIIAGPVLTGGGHPFLVFARLWEWIGHLGEIAVGGVASTAEIRLSPGGVLCPLIISGGALLLGFLRFRRRDIP